MDDHAEWEDTQSDESVLKRLIAFLRSVIPEDPAQLLFLAGAILLLIAPRVPWRPDALVQGSKLNDWEVYGYIGAANILVLVAGLTALFACFWQLRNPVRTLFGGVLGIGLLGLLFLLLRFFDLASGWHSVLDPNNRDREMLGWVKLNIHNFPTGFYILALGLVLICAFLSRMALRVGTLPLTLSNANTVDIQVQKSWPGDRLVLFVLAGVFGLVANGAYLLAIMLWKLPLVRLNSGFAGYVVSLASALLNAGVLLSVSLLLLGKRGRIAAQLSLKLPDPRFVALGFLLPAAVYMLAPFGHFIFDRIHWAAYDFGKFHPPILSTYFDFGRVGKPWVVFLIFAAFAEEIIFRGVLLSDFVRRYGLHRGIFLTGIGWAAIHFRSDSYARLGVLGVFFTVLFRVSFCVGMNYVLAWMVLHWKSVIPAGIAHTVWNMLAASAVGGSSPWSSDFVLVSWTAAALVLYRYWPLSNEEGPEPESLSASITPTG